VSAHQALHARRFIKEAFEMRLGMIVAVAAIAVTVLIARGCSERRDSGAMNVGTAGAAGTGDESQSGEFSLSANDDEGFDLPEREEIRQKRKHTPGTKVFVHGRSPCRSLGAQARGFTASKGRDQ
jgi:hypothetical protein